MQGRLKGSKNTIASLLNCVRIILVKFGFPSADNVSPKSQYSVLRDKSAVLQADPLVFV